MQPATFDAQVDRVLRQVAELERRVARLEAGRGQHDPEADARLLAAMAAGFGSAVFSAADAVWHARHDAELRHALAGVSARRLGKWLRRLSTSAAPGRGYRVVKVGRDGAGSLWTVQVCD